MADFLSQFVGKDETPSVEFKHRRGSRKVSDSSKRVKDSHIAPSFGKGDHKVGDAFSDIASYADVAEALSSCRIGYSLDDYRIWSDALSLDNHGKEDRLTVMLFADGFDDNNDESSMEAYYDEFGIDNFYHNFAITTLGVHIKEKGAWDDLVVDCYVPTASITAGVVSRLVNAICFCHEEHCSLSEALQYLKENVPELLFELQVSVGDIQQKFGVDVGYLDLPVSSAVGEKDSFYNKSAWGASESDITRIISESNPILEYLGGGSGVMGKSLTFAIKGMEDVSYIDIPVTKTTTLRELSDLISPDNLEFPSEVSDSSNGVKDSTKKVKDAEGHNSRFGDSWLIRNMSDSGIRNFLHHLLPGTNPAIKFKGVHRKGDGSSGLLIFNLREGGVNHPITIPFTATTSAFDLKELIDPDNLEHPIKDGFPSEVSDSLKRVKDSAKKVSDAEGDDDDDDDDFEDEPEREFTDEEIVDFARNHDGFGYELYEEAYRDKGYDDDIWETMDRLDDVIVDQPASWLLDRMFYGNFNPRHAYWKFNGYGNLESFDGSFTSLFDKHIDETVMVEYIRDNMDKYREYLEEYFEDDED